MERMSGLDAGFFFADNDRTPLQIASVGVFEGPPPPYGDIVRLIVSRLPRVPRYRQRVRTIPFNLARPVWVDDPHFQILYHVRHTAVPAPGGPEELRNLCGRILAQRLDFSRPLWESWIIEGLAGGRWAAVSKVHHCMMDGVGGNDLVVQMLDHVPDPSHTQPSPADAPPAEQQPWTPRPEPSTLSLVFDGIRSDLAESARQLLRLPAVARRLGSRDVTNLAGGLPQYAGQLAHAGPPSLNGPTSPHRRWCWTRTDLEEVKRVRRAFGVKVNDVILAATAAGFRDMFEARGVLDENTVVRAMVPVSLRLPDEHGVLTNRVSCVLVNLPCGEPDPVRRLHLVNEEMNFVKHTHQEILPDAVVRMFALAPTALAAISHTALRLRQPVIHAVTTNVPGPPFPLYILGRKLVEIYPYVPIALGLRVSIGSISYLDDLFVGLTGDFDAVPDLETLGEGIRSGFGELAKEAARI